MQFDLRGIDSPKSYGEFLWPNELSSFHDKCGQVLLVPDGFLTPGQSDGGVYGIRNWQSSRPSSHYRLTRHKEGWFYHRAVYVKLPNGHEGILTARASKPILGSGIGKHLFHKNGIVGLYVVLIGHKYLVYSHAMCSICICSYCHTRDDAQHCCCDY
jgi:hypothetical protein